MTNYDVTQVIRNSIVQQILEQIEGYYRHGYYLLLLLFFN